MVEFTSTNLEEWSAALAAYGERMEALGKPKLIGLDTFYRVELPKLLECRQPEAYITRDELIKIMNWKLSRGKWRSRLLNFVSSLSDDEVRSASEKAFAALPNLKEAISLLSVLKGVGPATASAVLAVHTPSIAPFMSDEARFHAQPYQMDGSLLHFMQGMLAALGGVKDYSMKQYLLFADKLQKKAEELQQAGAPELQSTFTPSDVERALWSTAASTMPQKTPKSINSRKSKVVDPDEGTPLTIGKKRQKRS